MITLIHEEKSVILEECHEGRGIVFIITGFPG